MPFFSWPETFLTKSVHSIAALEEEFSLAHCCLKAIHAITLLCCVWFNTLHSIYIFRSDSIPHFSNVSHIKWILHYGCPECSSDDWEKTYHVLAKRNAVHFTVFPSGMTFKFESIALMYSMKLNSINVILFCKALQANPKTWRHDKGLSLPETTCLLKVSATETRSFHLRSDCAVSYCSSPFYPEQKLNYL